MEKNGDCLRFRRTSLAPIRSSTAKSAGCPLFSLLLCTLLAACSPPPESSGLQAIVGARLEAGRDAAPIPYSVVIVAAGKIVAAGPQAEVPVPKGAQITRGNGKVVQPASGSGRIAPGEPADLVLRDAATGATEKIMHNGEWLK